MKAYSIRLLNIANQVRLFGQNFHVSRIVQKILVTLLERFESTILSLENSNDLTIMSSTKVLRALQAQEQRNSWDKKAQLKELCRQSCISIKKQKKKKKWREDWEESLESRSRYPPCWQYGKNEHPLFRC